MECKSLSSLSLSFPTCAACMSVYTSPALSKDNLTVKTWLSAMQIAGAHLWFDLPPFPPALLSSQPQGGEVARKLLYR